MPPHVIAVNDMASDCPDKGLVLETLRITRTATLKSILRDIAIVVPDRSVRGPQAITGVTGPIKYHAGKPTTAVTTQHRETLETILSAEKVPESASPDHASEEKTWVITAKRSVIWWMLQKSLAENVSVLQSRFIGQTTHASRQSLKHVQTPYFLSLQCKFWLFTTRHNVRGAGTPKAFGPVP